MDSHVYYEGGILPARQTAEVEAVNHDHPCVLPSPEGTSSVATTSFSPFPKPGPSPKLAIRSPD